MSDDPVLSAVQRFMDAVESRIARQDTEIRSLRDELQTRAAVPSFTIPAPIPGKDGENGKDGTNGRGIARAEVREAGDLIFLYTDGTEQNVGRIVGEKGKDGVDGKDAVAVDGKDGKDGLDGKDGERGADGIASQEEIESLIETRFADVQTRTLADFHQRTFAPGTNYKRGGVVAWSGATWLAMADTGATPGTSPDWQLLAKQGRDGRDARK